MRNVCYRMDNFALCIQILSAISLIFLFPIPSFKMVVFDPPHLVWAGKAANLYKRYGVLNKDWRTELAMGFKECFRVLEPYGVLIFKWSEAQLKLKTILSLTEEKPLFGHKRGSTFWVAFMKMPTK